MKKKMGPTKKDAFNEKEMMSFPSNDFYCKSLIHTHLTKTRKKYTLIDKYYLLRCGLRHVFSSALLKYVFAL